MLSPIDTLDPPTHIGLKTNPPLGLPMQRRMAYLVNLAGNLDFLSGIILGAKLRIRLVFNTISEKFYEKHIGLYPIKLYLIYI